MHSPEVKKLRSGNSFPSHRGAVRRVPHAPPVPVLSGSSYARTQGVRVGKQLIGGSSVTWIAGPGAIESSAQMVSIGASLEEVGVKFIRASLPRVESRKSDAPCGFTTALKLLCATARRYGMSVVSEVTDLSQVDALAEHCDILELRNSEDDELLLALGAVNRTIILHRSPTMGLAEFFHAVKLLEQGGRATIVLAERGVVTSDPRAQQILDVSSIVTLKRQTPYPVLVDCAALTSDASYADHLAVAAVAAGADGVMVDVVSPSHVVADEAPSRALLPYQLGSMIRRIEALKFTLNALIHRDFEAAAEAIK